MKHALLQICLLLPLLACTQGQAGAPESVRVIIRFAEPGLTRDAAFLARLETTAKLHLEYAAAISPDSAAYQLACDAADTACAQAIARLRTQPGVLRVSPDRKETIQ